jgi:hypothetical protein
VCPVQKPGAPSACGGMGLDCQGEYSLKTRCRLLRHPETIRTFRAGLRKLRTGKDQLLPQ